MGATLGVTGMTPRFSIALILFSSAFVLASAQAQERTADQSGGWVLGVFYFEQLCRRSIGNPPEFHRLVASSDLKKLSEEAYQQVKSREGLEGWERRGGNVRVMVEYTRSMGCQVWMSHAAEVDITAHIATAAKAEDKIGKKVVLVKNELAAPPGIPPYRVLQFHIYSPGANYYLLGIASKEQHRGNQAMFGAGPFR